MGLPEWNWIIENKSFVEEGILNDVKAGQVVIGLNKTRTASFKIRLDNTLAPYIAQQCAQEPIYIRAERDGFLMFHGPIATAQEVGDDKQEAQLQVNSTGPEFILAEHFYTGAAAGVKIAPGTDHAKWFAEAMNTYSTSGSPGTATHVAWLAGSHFSSNTSEIEITAFQTMAEILQNLSQQAAGFDWLVVPTEATAAGNIGVFNAEAVIGVEKPNAVFEWGAGLTNLNSFNRTVDLTQMANVIYNYASGGPEAPGSGTLTSEYTNAELELWGLRQALMNISVLNNEARQAYINEAHNYRKKPRETLQLTPITDPGTGRLPIYGADYSVGDFIRARIVYEGSVHIDALTRVWGVQFDVDQNGKEQQTLITSPS